MPVIKRGPDECWPWDGGTNKDGYGQFRAGPTVVQAHRVAYVLLVGQIPRGYHIDHLCKNRLCCNPSHLEAVTQLENNRRSPRQQIPRTYNKFPDSHIWRERQARGLSRRQLSEASGVSEWTIMNYEMGRHTPRPSTVLALTDALERIPLERAS